MGTTIHSSGIDVLVVPWVSVGFRTTRMRCDDDSVSPISYLFRCVLWLSTRFCGILETGNHRMDSVAIRALSIVFVLIFSFFLLYAMSYILDLLSRIQSLPLVLELFVCELFSEKLPFSGPALRSLESGSCTPFYPVTSGSARSHLNSVLFKMKANKL